MDAERFFSQFDEPPVKVDGFDNAYVRVMSGTERDEFDGFINDADKKPHSNSLVYAKLVQLCACDANGERIFADDDPSVISKRMSVKALKRIADKALKVNLLGVEGIEAEKKESAGVANHSSGSSSLALSA